MTTGAVKDSKQQLVQSFQQIRADRKKLDAKIATKQEEAEKVKNQEILAAASTYTVDSIVKGLADLQLEFGSIVNTLAEKLAQENTKLDELNRAIEIETQRLQELRQIRIVADTSDIFTQEHREKLKVLEQDTANRKEALEKEAATRRKEWQKEQIEFTERIQAENDVLAKNRQQEQEEHEYKLATTRKLTTDAYEAKKRNLEREITEITQQKEKDWNEREKVLTDNQKLFTEYQQQAVKFPTELEEAVKKAREEAIRETSQKAKVEVDLFEKEWESTKQSKLKGLRLNYKLHSNKLKI